jgi:hypothetical protein
MRSSPIQVRTGERTQGENKSRVGGGLLYSQRDFSQQKSSCLSLPCNQRGYGFGGFAGDGIVSTVFPFSDIADELATIQGFWFGYEHELGVRGIDSLATGTLREIRGSSFGHEG